MLALGGFPFADWLLINFAANGAGPLAQRQERQGGLGRLPVLTPLILQSISLPSPAWLLRPLEGKVTAVYFQFVTTSMLYFCVGSVCVCFNPDCFWAVSCAVGCSQVPRLGLRWEAALSASLSSKFHKHWGAEADLGPSPKEDNLMAVLAVLSSK